MCHAARCRTCGKITWRGCGLHVAQVKATVPADLWCAGHPHAEQGGGIIRRLLRR